MLPRASRAQALTKVGLAFFGKYHYHKKNNDKGNTWEMFISYESSPLSA